MRAFCKSTAAVAVVLGSLLLHSALGAEPKPSGFHVEEATIADIHRAIQSGDTTCQQVIQAFVDRARAYNGICTRLVTADGKPIKPGKGIVRAGAPLVFPKDTVAVSKILPDFDQYKGLPIEYGRMEAT